MPCYHPVTGYRSKCGPLPNGKWPIVFNAKEGYIDKEVTIPCGRCIGCRLERSRQWAIRISHEASLYDSNCFVTLTYDDDYISCNRSLNKRDIQLFFKRLRKKYGDKKIRYFQCGEYGKVCKVCGKSKIYCKCVEFVSVLGRPHHHICFFDLDFDDKVLFAVRKGYRYYRSQILEDLWPFGFSVISDLTFESAAYTARYITKKITGEQAASHYEHRLPEYVTMSRRSGIGKEYWRRFKQDIIVGDMCVIRNDLKVKPAKYYDSLFDLENPLRFKEVKRCRLLKAKDREEENSYPRLAVREKIHNIKAKTLLRSFEDA